MQVEGSIHKISFNNKTRVFNMAYKPNYNIHKDTKVYINNQLHYTDGYTLTITPKDSVILDENENHLIFYLNRQLKVSTINILVIPK